MVTDKDYLESVFALMQRYGVKDLQIVTADATLHVEMPLHHSKPVLPIEDGPFPGEDDDIISSSRVMAPAPWESVYDDPDLYPDGVDPVALMREGTEQ